MFSNVSLCYFKTLHHLVMCHWCQHIQLTVLPKSLVVLQCTAFSHGYCFPNNVVMCASLWPDYLLVVDAGMSRQAGRRGSTEAPQSVFCLFQKHAQELKLWVYFQYSKCFWKRYNAAWSFQGEPSSNRAVPTAAVYTVNRAQLASSLVSTINILDNRIFM
jgi:hypothetical protein